MAFALPLFCGRAAAVVRDGPAELVVRLEGVATTDTGGAADGLCPLEDREAVRAAAPAHC